MRLTLALAAVALTLAACSSTSSDSNAGEEAFLEQAGINRHPDDIPNCADLDVVNEVADLTCRQDNGKLLVQTAVTLDCQDGSTLYKTDLHWGYYGQPTHHGLDGYDDAATACTTP